MMNSNSIREYLQHYGKIRTLRGSVIRSTFRRVTAAFDEYNPEHARAAMQELGLDPDNLSCVYCGSSANCWDHLIPAAREGTHQLRNLAPACTGCNNRKGNKTWGEYFQSLPVDQDTEVRRNRLAKFTADYQPGQSLIEDEEDRKKLDDLLDQIHRAMIEADEVIAKAIARRSARDDA